MAGIEIRPKQLSARLGQRARPVETSVAKQVQLQGIQAGTKIAGNLALTIYENKSRAATANANNQRALDEQKYRAEFAKELAGAKTVLQKQVVEQTYKDGYKEHWKSSYGEARNMTLPGSRKAFDAIHSTSEEFDALNMNAFINQEGTAAIKVQGELEVKQAILDGDLRRATNLNKGYESFLGTRFFTLQNEINKIQKGRKENTFGEYLRNIAIEDKGDWTRAILAAADPKVQKELGVDGATAKRILAEQQAFQSAIKENDDAIKEKVTDELTVDMYTRAFNKDLSVFDDTNYLLQAGVSVSDIKSIQSIAGAKFSDVPDFVAERTVRDAIIEMGQDSKSKVDVVRILGENTYKMTESQNSSIQSLIDTERSKSETYWVNEARHRMEEKIRDKDPFSGAYTDDQQQINASAEALIELENDEREAVKSGKPLTGTDLLVRGMEIAALKRIQINEENRKNTEFNPEVKFDPKIPPNGLESVWKDMPDSVKEFARGAIQRGVTSKQIIDRWRQTQ